MSLILPEAECQRLFWDQWYANTQYFEAGPRAQYSNISFDGRILSNYIYYHPVNQKGEMRVGYCEPQASDLVTGVDNFWYGYHERTNDFSVGPWTKTHSTEQERLAWIKKSNEIIERYALGGLFSDDVNEAWEDEENPVVFLLPRKKN